MLFVSRRTDRSLMLITDVLDAVESGRCQIAQSESGSGQGKDDSCLHLSNTGTVECGGPLVAI